MLQSQPWQLPATLVQGEGSWTSPLSKSSLASLCYRTTSILEEPPLQLPTTSAHSPCPNPTQHQGILALMGNSRPTQQHKGLLRWGLNLGPHLAAWQDLAAWHTSPNRGAESSKGGGVPHGEHPAREKRSAAGAWKKRQSWTSWATVAVSLQPLPARTELRTPHAQRTPS